VAVPTRLVALGASNLTRALATVVAGLRHAAGPDAEVFAALGLGRSYGMTSRVLARTLPGILDCGLWSALDARPPRRMRALVTDVGNDILYGAPAERILDWVEQAVVRLRRLTGDVVVAGLPLDSLRRLTPARFAAFRTLFYPPSRVRFREGLAAAEAIERGLAAISARHGARFVPLRRDWYGVDPVHIRGGAWREAWGELTGLGAGPAAGWAETARVLTLPAERRRLLGVERVRPQDGRRLPRGGRLWLY
jgi:hypothetical protein